MKNLIRKINWVRYGRLLLAVMLACTLSACDSEKSPEELLCDKLWRNYYSFPEEGYLVYAEQDLIFGWNGQGENSLYFDYYQGNLLIKRVIERHPFEWSFTGYNSIWVGYYEGGEEFFRDVSLSDRVMDITIGNERVRFTN